MSNYKLKEILKIRNGRDHQELEDGKFPVYGSGGIMRFVNQYLYDKPSILLPRKGTLDNIQFCDTPFWTVDTTYYTEINEVLVNPYFLYRYLRLLDLSNLSSGTGVPSMTFDSYYDIKVDLPEKSAQDAIASVLSSLDRKISLNRKANELLESMAKQLYDYWFVQFDFPNAEGKPYKSSGGKMVYNEKLKREIPEGWEVVTIQDVSKRVKVGFVGTVDKYYCNSNEGVGIIRPSEMTRDGINYDNTRYVTEGFHIANKKSQLHKDDILISRNDLNGIPNWHETDDEFQVLNAVIIEPDRDIASSPLLCEIIKSPLVNAQIKNFFSGSTLSVLNTEMVAKLCFPFSREIAENIHNKLLGIYKCIENNRKANRKLTSFRDYLLPLLMNGQVKVS